MSDLQFLAAPLHYWRSILLVYFVGLFVSAISTDVIAVLLAVSAAAFFFRYYELRRWIDVPAHLTIVDVLTRLSLAFAWTFTLTSTDFGRLLVSLVRWG